MKRLKLKIIELRIDYNNKKWRKAIEGMDKHLHNYTCPEFRKYADLNSKYGHKSLALMNEKLKLIKELGLDK